MFTIPLIVETVLIPSVLSGIFVGGSIFLLCLGIHLCFKLFKL